MTKILPPPERRTTVLYMGASNFSRGLAAFWSQAVRRLDTPLDLLGFLGHGRSYCGDSFLGPRGFQRRFVGIERSLRSGGFFATLQRRVEDGQSLNAMIGDFGNDLAYGFSASQILEALCRCVASLPRECRQIWVLPPVEAVGELGPRQFTMLSRLIYSGRSIEKAQVMQELVALERGLRDQHAANPEGIVLVEIPRSWMAWDRIHVRRRMLRSWAKIMVDAIDSENQSPNVARESYEAETREMSLRERLGLRSQHCDLQVLGRQFGVGVGQPCFTGQEGSTLSLY